MKIKILALWEEMFPLGSNGLNYRQWAPFEPLCELIGISRLRSLPHCMTEDLYKIYKSFFYKIYKSFFPAHMTNGWSNEWNCCRTEGLTPTFQLTAQKRWIFSLSLAFPMKIISSNDSMERNDFLEIVFLWRLMVSVLFRVFYLDN